MAQRQRPLGVTAICVLCFIGIIFNLLLLGLSLKDNQLLTEMLRALSSQGAGPMALLRMGSFMRSYFVIGAVISAVLFWGMWTLKNWARVATAVLAALSIGGSIAFLAFAWSQLATVTVAVMLARVAIAALVVWYVLRPQTREAFAGSTAAAARA